MSERPARSSKRSGRVARREAEERAAQRRRRFLVLGGAVVLAIAVVAVLILANRPADEPAELLVANAIDDAIPTDGRALGDAAAPVTVVEWGDYQ